MPYALVHLTVRDFAQWKTVFDEQSSPRGSAGSEGGYVFRSADEPNEAFVLLEWDDLPNARNFFQSPDRGPAMERAGVAEQPDIYFLEQADRPSA